MPTRNPDEKPPFNAAHDAFAEQHGLHPVNVICAEPEGDASDPADSVSFIVYVHFIPRAGENIKLQDGKVCRVISVYHGVVKPFPEGPFTLMPNVFAVWVK